MKAVFSNGVETVQSTARGVQSGAKQTPVKSSSSTTLATFPLPLGCLSWSECMYALRILVVATACALVTPTLGSQISRKGAAPRTLMLEPSPETKKHLASGLRLCWRPCGGDSHFPLSQSVGRISWISVSAHVESAKNTTNQTKTVMREDKTCPIAESISNISVQNLQGG
jgi:hypothetical protein